MLQTLALIIVLYIALRLLGDYNQHKRRQRINRLVIDDHSTTAFKQRQAAMHNYFK